jgi:DNA-binding NarL/FixJ family response regulator
VTSATSDDLTAMIRVLVVDDHPVLRAGVETLLRMEPGFSCAGTSADAQGLWPLLRSTEPDVVLLDRQLPDADGLDVARDIAAEPYPPAVVLYTADPASAASDYAVAIVDKADGTEVLFDALRLAARGVIRAPGATPPSTPAA